MGVNWIWSKHPQGLSGKDAKYGLLLRVLRLFKYCSGVVPNIEPMNRDIPLVMRPQMMSCGPRQQPTHNKQVILVTTLLSLEVFLWLITGRS